VLFIPPEMYFDDDRFPRLIYILQPYRLVVNSKNKVEIEYDPGIRYTEYFGALHLGKSMY
jgi:hypothetical protein